MLGTIALDLPPLPGNPRNSEGAMLRLRSGGILLAYSRFTGADAADDARAEIWAAISMDEGMHFGAPRCLFRPDPAEKNLMSVSLMRMANGDIGLFYLLRRDDADLRMVLRRSSDEGRSWSAAAMCMPAPGFYVVNNDRAVRLASGRIYIPAACHRRSVGEDGALHYDSRSEFVGFCSDDDGRTWRECEGKAVLAPMGCSRSGLQEPGVLELRPGLLWGWARTDLGRQYECFSMDDGEHWTPAEPSRFTSPLSPLSARRLPDGRVLAVYNPVPLYNDRPERVGGVWTGGRTPLCIALSGADGRSFSAPVAVEEDAGSGYCYTAILPVAGGVLLAYCAGGPGDGSCLARLRIRRISNRELEGIR